MPTGDLFLENKDVDKVDKDRIRRKWMPPQCSGAQITPMYSLNVINQTIPLYYTVIYCKWSIQYCAVIKYKLVFIINPLYSPHHHISKIYNRLSSGHIILQPLKKIQLKLYIFSQISDQKAKISQFARI